MRNLLLVAAAAAVCGCATEFSPIVEMPRNATLRTLDGPLIQAHRGSRGEY